MNSDIVAEVGSTWYHPKKEIAYENAIQSIKVAIEAGANIVKFQLFRADTLYSKTRAPELHEEIKKYELPATWISKLSMETHKHLGAFWLSIFSPDLLNVCEGHVDGLKIASGDITNHSLIDAVAKYCKHNVIPMAVSTGAATRGEIYDAISIVDHYKIPELIVFHCVSLYPASAFDMNLMSGVQWLHTIGLHVSQIGLSDHTKDSLSAQIAVGMGYTIFEKHFTLSTAHKNPDRVVASNEVSFEKYVRNIADAEKVVGTKWKVVSDTEERERIMARRGKDGLRPTREIEDE